MKTRTLFIVIAILSFVLTIAVTSAVAYSLKKTQYGPQKEYENQFPWEHNLDIA